MTRWIVVLGLVAVCQAWLLGGGRAETWPERPTVGEQLAGFDTEASGRSAATVLWAFRESCVHCQTVAPQWAHWMTQHKDSVRLVAVTLDDEATGKRFITSNQWPAELRTVAEGDRVHELWAVASRTPWIWLLDASGVLRYQGHGAALAELDLALVELAVR